MSGAPTAALMTGVPSSAVAMVTSIVSSFGNGFGTRSGLRLGSDGQVYLANGTSASYVTSGLNEWLTLPLGPGSFECSWLTTYDSGGGMEGGSSLADGTWLPLTSDRQWSIYVSGYGYQQIVGTLKIRMAGSGRIMHNASFTLQGDDTP